MEKKNFLIKIIAAGLFLILVFNPLEAALFDENAKLSVGVGLGIGYTQDNRYNNHFGYVFKTDFRSANHYFSCRLIRILPSCYSYDPMGELSILYGLVIWDDKESGSISAGVGIGLAGQGIGLPLEIQLNLQYFLVYAFGNINSGSSLVGFGIGFRFGHF